jgi:predicted DNA-binding WGR domain protein
MKAYLEYKDPKSEKFWEMSVTERTGDHQKTGINT